MSDLSKDARQAVAHIREGKKLLSEADKLRRDDERETNRERVVIALKDKLTKSVRKGTAQQIEKALEHGADLIQLKELTDDFGEWLETALSWSQRTAERLMRARRWYDAQSAENRHSVDSKFSVAALYVVSAKKLTDDQRTQILALADTLPRVDQKDAIAVAKKLKPAPATAPAPKQPPSSLRERALAVGVPEYIANVLAKARSGDLPGYEDLIEHREKLLAADRVAAALLQNADFEQIKQLARLLKNENDWAEIGTMLRARVMTADKACETSFAAIEHRWNEIFPKRQDELSAEQYRGDSCEMWSRSENLCRKHYVGESLDRLIEDFAISSVQRLINVSKVTH